MKYYKYNSQKSFLASNTKGAVIRRLFETEPQHEKLWLKHKNCPVDIVEDFATNGVWYKRITAMLAQCRWEKYIERAMRDSKSTVRYCAYKRAFFQNYKVKYVIQLIKADKYLGGYKNRFNWEYLEKELHA